MHPDFLGIGAQKAATTWLYHILNIHPKIWMPPAKELHFFDDNKESNSHLKRVIFKSGNFNRSRKRFHLSLLKNVKWSYHYLCKDRTISNYLNLFRPKDGQIAGEITPAYANLKTDEIVQLNKYLPDVKIIYILRNPIERDWSATCMYCKNVLKKAVGDLSIEELSRIVNKPGRKNHSSYSQNIENWTKVFHDTQLFIRFYDEIQNDPKDFIIQLFTFLNLEPVPLTIFDKFMERKINSYSKPIPNELLKLIANKEYNNIQEIHLRYNNSYTASWVNQVESILHN